MEFMNKNSVIIS